MRAGGSPGSPPTSRADVSPDLEVTHRLRARAEDRILSLKDTSATNLALQAFDKNQVWLALSQLADELLVWTQLLSLARPTSQGLET